MKSPNEVAWMHGIIDAVHCPDCGQPAEVQAQTLYEVFDVWACGTEGCSFNWATGDRTWTLGLTS